MTAGHNQEEHSRPLSHPRKDLPFFLLLKPKCICPSSRNPKWWWGSVCNLSLRVYPAVSWPTLPVPQKLLSWVKCLPCNNKGLSGDSRKSCKKQAQLCSLSTREADTEEHPGLSGQPRQNGKMSMSNLVSKNHLAERDTWFKRLGWFKCGVIWLPEESLSIYRLCKTS